MNSEQTGKTLLNFIEGAAQLGSLRDPSREKLLAQSLLKGKRKSVAVALSSSKIMLRKLPNATPNQIKVSALLPLVRSLSEVLQFAGKAGALKSLKDLEGFITEHAEMSVDSFLSRLSQVYGQPPSQSVEEHLHDLRNTWKDKNNFSKAMNFLRADSTLKVADLRLIASEFTGFPQKGPKKALFAAIEKRHQNYIDAIKRQNAAGGKSAA